MIKKYKLIAVGGTFDNLHKGHRSLLTKAFSFSEKVIIGITSDTYALKNKIREIEIYKKRKEAVENFLFKKDFADRSKIIKLDNKFGKTINSKRIDSIIVTKCTLKTAKLINKKRGLKKMSKLTIVISEYFLAEDGLLISSKRIREGQIDKEGKVYLNKEWLNKNLILPQSLRPLLKKPFGEIVKGKMLINSQLNIATVGDVATQKFNKLYGNQKISIIDLLVGRKKVFSDIKQLKFKNNKKLIKVSNPPGMIAHKLFIAIQKSFKSDYEKIILIKGEEDLAVLPLAILAPLNFQIYYGQPGKGIIKVVVNESVKKSAYSLLSQFNFETR